MSILSVMFFEVPMKKILYRLSVSFGVFVALAVAVQTIPVLAQAVLGTGGDTPTYSYPAYSSTQTGNTGTGSASAGSNTVAPSQTTQGPTVIKQLPDGAVLPSVISADCSFTLPQTVGDRGVEVVRLQNVLIKEGLLASDNNTGFFGLMTKAAVAAFQQRYGLEAVGSIGPLSRARLINTCSGYLQATLPVNQVQTTTQVAPTTGTTPTNNTNSNSSSNTSTGTSGGSSNTTGSNTSSSNTNNNATQTVSYVHTETEVLKRLGFSSKVKNFAKGIVALDPKGSEPVETAISGGSTPTSAERAQAEKYAAEFNLSSEDIEITPQAVAACQNEVLRGDFNKDRVVDYADLIILGDYYGQAFPSQYLHADLGGDGQVGFDELLALAQDFGKVQCQTEPEPEPNPEPTGSFPVFDGVGGYVGQPDVVANGMIPIEIGWSGHYFANQNVHGEQPDEDRVRAYARSLPQNAYHVIDIEHWAHDARIPSHTPAKINQTIEKFTRIIDWMEDERPDLTFGIYSMAPVSDYWNAASYGLGIDSMERINRGEYSDFLAWAASGVAQRIPNDPQGRWQPWEGGRFTIEYRKWQAANRAIAPLAQIVDFVVPQIYTPQTGEGGVAHWMHMAKYNIEEAKQYGKPVYPIVWPRYFYSPNAQIAPDLFRQQLEKVKSSGADGVIVWDSGWTPTGLINWQDFAWTDVIETFIRRVNSGNNTSAVSFATEDFTTEYMMSIYAIALSIIAVYVLARLTMKKKKHVQKMEWK